MPDPISILSITLEVGQLCIECAKALYEIYRGAQQIEESVKALCHEVESVGDIATAVERVLRDPAVQAFEDIPLWTTAGGSLRSCVMTLTSFDACLKSLRSGGNPRNWYRDGIRQIALMLKEEDISKFRAELETHKSALNVMLGAINLYVSCTAPAVVLNTLGPRLDSMEKLLLKLDENMQSTTENSGGPDAHIMESSIKLGQSAKLILANATDIMSETNSTICDTDMHDLTSRLGNMPRLYQDRAPTTRVVSAELESRVAQWMAADTQSDTLSSDTLTKLDADRYQNTGPEETNLGNELDSDDEFDLEMTQQYMDLGSQGFLDSKFEDAETYFKRALPHARLLPHLRDPLDEAELKIKLALSLLEQDKFKESEEICDKIIQLPVVGESDRTASIDASFILAKIHLATKNVDRAMTYCRQTMKARRRFNGSTAQCYLEAVALMQRICEVQGDVHGANACSRLLPANYHYPNFKVLKISSELSLSTTSSMQADIASGTTAPQSPRLSNTASTVPAISPQRSDSATERNDPNKARYASIASQLTSTPTKDVVQNVNPVSAKLPVIGTQWSAFRDKGLANLDETFYDKLPRDWREQHPRKHFAMSMTPLHWAAAGGYLGEVEGQLGAGIDSCLEPLKFSPLHVAVIFGQEDVVRLLLNRGASVGLEDCDKATPLMRAAHCGRDRELRLLLAAGASVDAAGNNGRMELLAAAGKGHDSTVKILLEAGAFIEAVDDKGWTALMVAAWYGYDNVVKVLLEAGASIETTDKDGWTALVKAARRGYVMVVKLLLEAGASINMAYQDGWTDLMTAANGGHDGVVKLLLEAGASTDTTNKYGRTALMTAVGNGHTGVVKLLLEAGADLTHKNNAGDTALSVSYRSGSSEMRRILEQHMKDKGIANSSREKTQKRFKYIGGKLLGTLI